jgi:hypothetical protein
VSLLSFDAIRIGLSPHRVELARVSRGLGAGKVLEEIVRECEPVSGQPNWAAALDTLDVLLAQMPKKRAPVSVVLSNHFVRYVVLPWQEDLSAADEITAAAAQRFTHLFGESVRGWDVRTAQTDYGQPGIACAIDGELLISLGDRINRGGLRLVSVQPLLLSAFNALRSKLDPSGALVVVESGRICLSVFREGQWQFVTSRRSTVWDPLQAIDRELAVLAGDLAPHRLDLLDLAAFGRWPSRADRPTQVHALPADRRCSLALCGSV